MRRDDLPARQNLLRRVGPERAKNLGVRAEVERTDAGCAHQCPSIKLTAVIRATRVGATGRLLNFFGADSNPGQAQSRRQFFCS